MLLTVRRIPRISFKAVFEMILGFFLLLSDICAEVGPWFGGWLELFS